MHSLPCFGHIKPVQLYNISIHIRHQNWIPEIEFYQKGNIEEETEEDTELDEILNNNNEHTCKQNKMSSV